MDNNEVETTTVKDKVRRYDRWDTTHLAGRAEARRICQALGIEGGVTSITISGDAESAMTATITKSLTKNEMKAVALALLEDHARTTANS